MAQDIVDDDLHEFEDTEIFDKNTLDIRAIHLHLHEITNWIEEGQFNIVIQYGKLYPNQKFEVKKLSKEEDSQRDGPQLEFFSNFKYVPGYNQLKIKFMNGRNTDQQQLGFCIVDLHGLNRSQFLTITKQLDNKDSIKNPESQFALARVKMTLFLEQGSKI